jgi:hypothetical protein
VRSNAPDHRSERDERHAAEARALRILVGAAVAVPLANQGEASWEQRREGEKEPANGRTGELGHYRCYDGYQATDSEAQDVLPDALSR